MIALNPRLLRIVFTLILYYIQGLISCSTLKLDLWGMVSKTSKISHGRVP